MTSRRKLANLRGWWQYRKTIANEHDILGHKAES